MTFTSPVGTHKTELAAFQEGEQVFVWGHDKADGGMWFLEEDTAKEHRPFVNDRIVCPVPGCAAKLTTHHRTNKRDGLVHYSGTGGHSKESVFHSQGCALIENWLRKKYPKSKAQREEYTNEAGERRADVLLTAPTGQRVAFEVQYSALTPDAWRARHDSYRAQGIVDVWLFGHTGAQLKFDSDGRLKANPTHDAVIASGSALMFINPIEEKIGIATGEDFQYSAETEEYGYRAIEVWDKVGRWSTLVIQALSTFEASPTRGLTGDFLGRLYERTEALRKRNIYELGRVAEVRERKRLQREEMKRKWPGIRAPRQEAIRVLLKEGGSDWGSSKALRAMRNYFRTHTKGRFDGEYDRGTGTFAPYRWQCIVYFNLIAGQDSEFDTISAAKTLKAHGIVPGRSDLTAISRWLYELGENGFIKRAASISKFPVWKPTESGAWW